MKALLLVFLLFSQFVWALPSDNSLLDKTTSVTGFGSIRYREPLSGSQGFPIVLIHGVYGGASHRAYRSLLPLLDQAGKAVYILDLPGVGESDKPKRAYRMEDLDLFVERFLVEVVKARATLVAESLMSASALKVSALRPDLVRRVVLLNPSGVNSLNQPPSDREQRLYDRLYNDDVASTQFYQNLLVDNSLRYFLKLGFYDDSFVNEDLLNDYRVMRDNLEQRWLTLSFVGGQLYRSFADSARDVFVPVMAIFGKEYEAFGDIPPATAADFAAIRPDFEYVEIPKSGAIVQREKPAAVAEQIIMFSQYD